jgi:hypothetical protein
MLTDSTTAPGAEALEFCRCHCFLFETRGLNSSGQVLSREVLWLRYRHGGRRILGRDGSFSNRKARARQALFSFSILS